MRLRGCKPCKSCTASFNSRTPCGVRLSIIRQINNFRHGFNSRTPCGVRPIISADRSGHSGFNSRTPCGVRPDVDRLCSDRLAVSIHAPRAGCDKHFVYLCIRNERFQFTHPVRGATLLCIKIPPCVSFQFTHPVRGATYLLGDAVILIGVSIHAPRAGCDSNN